MNVFKNLLIKLLNEDIAASTAFGTVDAGATGNQFPAQNSKGFNDGDNRPIDPYSAILGTKKKKRKKAKFPIQRRTFSGS